MDSYPDKGGVTMFVYIVVIVDEDGDVVDIAGIYAKREKAQWDINNNMGIPMVGSYEIEEREVQ
jgi:hypothetical protein